MKIIANKYVWDAPDTIRVGDRVLLPPTNLNGDEHEAIITSLEPNYQDAYTKSIIRVLEKV